MLLLYNTLSTLFRVASHNNRTLFLLGHKKSKTLSPHFGCGGTAQQQNEILCGILSVVMALLTQLKLLLASFKEATLLVFDRKISFWKNLKTSSCTSPAALHQDAAHPGLAPEPLEEDGSIKVRHSVHLLTVTLVVAAGGIGPCATYQIQQHLFNHDV